MRRLASAFVLAFGLLPTAGMAQTNPVVVELFTSQGCSSCPPADRLLKELSQSDNVIALAWHVDYWDYLGWKDAFAAPEFTHRQKYYALAMGERMIYTPQIVVDGTDHTVGGDPAKVMALIQKVHSDTPKANLTVAASDNKVRVTATLTQPVPGGVDVHLVRYTPTETVAIKRGENAGKVMAYSNIVTSWDVIAEWDGQGRLTLDVPRPIGDPAVILLQQEDTGPILAAARIN